jgi:hypothetical protein
MGPVPQRLPALARMAGLSLTPHDPISCCKEANMRSLIAAPLALILAFPIVAAAQETAAPKDGQPKVAEVRFGDGSIVRMTLLQEHVEVMTKYGKLTVPVGDIRRIDFGMHPPTGLSEQITTSIKLLGSEVYREREGASKELLQAGHWACPSLHRASKSPDAETAQRATQVLKQITEKVSPDLLRMKEEDVIHTNEFNVVGKILSHSIKAHSPHFGEVSIKLCDLRSLHLRQQCNTGEHYVDAGKYGCEPNQWLDTGVTVDSSMRLVLVVNGQVDLWPQTPGQYVAGAKGYNAVGKGGPFMAGSLIGRIGENGKAFLIGERFETSVGDEGKLFLHIVPSPWNSPSVGGFNVRIHTDPVALTAK